jgi:hypothetical protein
VRFPLDRLNLNIIISKNTVYKALDTYLSQKAVLKSERVLNGDKVFWERRTDSLLYNAEIQVGGVETNKLNDFKLKNFDNINDKNSENVGVEYLQGNAVHIRTMNPIKATSIYLYDNPDKEQNILKGYIVFDGTSKIEFGPLENDGSLTEILFPEKVFQQIDIVVTESEGDSAGLSGVEAYYDLYSKQKPQDTCLMAVDEEDNFVYDYILQEDDTVKLKLYSVPNMKQLRQEDIDVCFEKKEENASYHWEDDTLIIYCDKGNQCKITVSNETSSTTFAILNPGKLTCAYLTILRSVERTGFNLNCLATVAKDWFVRKIS